jgi:RNA polymerase sigma-70 factor (sigma-E family)
MGIDTSEISGAGSPASSRSDRPPHLTEPPGTGPPGPEDGDADVHALPFGQVYRAHLEPLLRFAVLVCGHRQQAEDAVAEAFARVLPRWRRGDVADPAAYLRRAVVNELTSRGRRRVLEDRQRGRLTRARRGADGVEVADAVADRGVVLDALRRLPVRQRAVLVLRFYEDMSERDVATVLGLSVGTVKSHAARGITRLRAEMEER